MGDSAEASLVLELADVVTTLTSRQNEFLGYVRGFRADVLGPGPTITYEPPPPRLLQPPPPPPPRRGVGTPTEPARLTRPLETVVAPPLPGPHDAPGTAEAGSQQEPDSSSPQAGALETVGDQRREVLRTKRDYDYFTELDDLLARIPPEATSRELDPPATK